MNKIIILNKILFLKVMLNIDLVLDKCSIFKYSIKLILKFILLNNVKHYGQRMITKCRKLQNVYWI